MKHLFSYCSGNNPEVATWQTYFKCVVFFFSLTLRQQFLSSLCSECPLILLQMSLYRGYCGHWCSHMQQDEAAWYRNGIIFYYGLWLYMLWLVFMGVHLFCNNPLQYIPLSSRYIVSHSMLNTTNLYTCTFIHLILRKADYIKCSIEWTI